MASALVSLLTDRKTTGNVQEDLTPEQRQELNLHYVKSIPEVLEIALPATTDDAKRDAEVREQVLTGAHAG